METATKGIKRTRVPWIRYHDFRICYGDGVVNVRGNYTREKVKEEQPPLNSYQYYLFKQAMNGLNGLAKDQLRDLRGEEQGRIYGLHLLTKRIVEEFIQEKMILLTNHWLSKLFPKSRITLWLLFYHSEVVKRTDWIESNESEPDYICTLTKEQMKITNKELVDVLIMNDVLPGNFFRLTVRDDPRARKLQQKRRRAIDEL